MAGLTAKVQIQPSLHRCTPHAAEIDIKIGSEALVYRDEPGKWIGPFLVIDNNPKNIHVDQNGHLVQYSIDRCKPYKIEEETREVLHDSDNITDIALRESQNEDLAHSEEGFDAWVLPQSPEINPSVFVVQSISTSEPQAQHEDFVKAKKKEIEGLEARQIWTAVRKEDILIGANIVGGRFEITLKNYLTSEKTAKVR